MQVFNRIWYKYSVSGAVFGFADALHQAIHVPPNLVLLRYSPSVAEELLLRRI
jgi:hypothetical protein